MGEVVGVSKGKTKRARVGSVRARTLKPAGYIVAIDGPSGAGKSTVALALATVLGGRLLDTGGMYRGVAYHAIAEGIGSEKGFAKIARRLVFALDERAETLLINNESLGHLLRTPEVSKLASDISRFRPVREILTRKQRKLAKEWAKEIPVVVEGRDIGTVVFPKVRFKFFVTADPEVRALRRFNQLRAKGLNVTLEHVQKQHVERDEQDSTREHAPLKCAEDAVVVDTSRMEIDQVVEFLRTHIVAHTKRV